MPDINISSLDRLKRNFKHWLRMNHRAYYSTIDNFPNSKCDRIVGLHKYPIYTYDDVYYPEQCNVSGERQ